MNGPVHDERPGHDHGDGSDSCAAHAPATDAGHRPGADPVAVAVRLAPGERAAAVARARRLNQVSLAWNMAEMVVALLAGAAAGSVSLLGFGIRKGLAQAYNPFVSVDADPKILYCPVVYGHAAL